MMANWPMKPVNFFIHLRILLKVSRNWNLILPTQIDLTLLISSLMAKILKIWLPKCPSSKTWTGAVTFLKKMRSLISANKSYMKNHPQMRRASWESLLKDLKNTTNKKTVKIATWQLLIKQQISKILTTKRKSKRTKNLLRMNLAIIYSAFIQILPLP